MRSLLVGLAVALLGPVATASAGQPFGAVETLPGFTGITQFGGLAPDGTLLLVGFGDVSGARLVVRPPGGPAGAPQPLPVGFGSGQVKLAIGPRGDAFLWSDAAVAYRPAGGAVGAAQAMAAPPRQVRLNRSGAGLLLAQGAGNQVLAVSRSAGADAQWDTAGAQPLGTGAILALALDPDGMAVALWISGTKLQQAVRPAGATQFGAPTDLPLPAGLSDDGVRSQDRAEADPSGWAIAATAATTGTTGVSPPTAIVTTIRAPGGTFSAVQSVGAPIGSFAVKGAAVNDQGGSLISFEDSDPVGLRTKLVRGSASAFGAAEKVSAVDQVIGAGHDLAAISYAETPTRIRVLRFTGPAATQTGQTDFDPGAVAGWLADGPGGGLAVAYRQGSDYTNQRLRVAPPEVNPLTVALDVPEPVSADIVGVNLTATNDGPDPLSLTFPSGMGVARDDSVSGGAPVGLRPVFPPVPGFVPTLAPGAAAPSLLAFEITSPGVTRLVTRVRAAAPDGAQYTTDAALRLDASLRPMTSWELRQTVAGGLTLLADKVQEVRRRAVTDLTNQVRRSLAKSKIKGAKALLKTSPYERALARRSGLPDNALSWLPAQIRRSQNNQFSPPKPGYAELTTLFIHDGSQAFLKQIDKALGNVNDKVLVTPGLFWRDYLRGVWNGQEGAINAELADAAGELSTKGKGYLSEAARFYTSSADLTDAWKELPKIYDETAAKVGALNDDAQNKILRWDKLMTDDPRKGTRQFAEALGNVEGFVAGGAIEDFFSPEQRAAQILGVLRKGSKAGDLADVVDATLEPGKVTSRLAQRGSVLVTREKGLARTPVAGMGNLNPDQLDFLSSTVAKLKKKFGVDIELQARPVNAYSAEIKDGIGKVEAVPTKNLTPDDVLMGAPQEWLGQTAYYKPQKPKGLETLKDVDRKRIELRYDEKLTEYRQFKGEIPDPTGKAAKVQKMLKKGGADVDLGQNYKGRIELAEIEQGGATLIQYKKLIVNGNPVFKGKPRPIVSDIDFNAVIDATTGRNLPAGIRGQVELELMNEFSKAQRSGLIPFGFHGWTHSGFDIESKDFRYVAKYMLMYASEAQALKYARHWAPKFFPELGKISDPRKFEREYRKAVEKILEGYTRGKHLVKITAEGATFGAGVDPTIGIPLP